MRLQVAGALRASGINRGDRVGLLIGNRVEWLEICFGAAALGAAVVPLSTWSKRREIDFLLSDSRIRTLFALDRFGEQDYAGDLGGLIPELRTHVTRDVACGSISSAPSDRVPRRPPLPATSSYATLVERARAATRAAPPGEGGR